MGALTLLVIGSTLAATNQLDVSLAAYSVRGLGPSTTAKGKTVIARIIANHGGRLLIDHARVEEECASKPACMREALEGVGGGLMISVLRVGPTVAVAVRMFAAKTGEEIYAKLITISASEFPSAPDMKKTVAGAVRALRKTMPAPAVEEIVAKPRPSSTAKPPIPVPGEDGLGLAPWLIVGGSSAVMITGAILLALGAADNAKVEEADPATPWREVKFAYDRGPVLSGTGIAMLSIGVAGIATGLWWYFSEDGQTELGVAMTPTSVVVAGVF